LNEGEEEDFEEVASGRNIEFDKGGEIIGVEVLKASRLIFFDLGRNSSMR